MNPRNWFVLLLLFFPISSWAENMIMLRVHHSFDDTMIMLKDKLDEYGYKVAHIQKCDGGLTDSGYQTDMYKSIFYGKFEEMRQLTNSHPEIIPYVPLKIAVMKEKDTVVLVALNPETLSEFFPDKTLVTQFGRWASDIRAIFEEVLDSKRL
ncbi:MAG: DUF302 domain-containing protein [Gammaproteobacteria bacterium]|nr:DUF302 domain-containing protein [Gammaproteobacteria bacterium]